jgi:hypothetical protein
MIMRDGKHAYTTANKANKEISRDRENVNRVVPLALAACDWKISPI